VRRTTLTLRQPLGQRRLVHAPLTPTISG
jgi:hypothetical protein